MKTKEIYTLIEKDIEEYFEKFDYSKIQDRYRIVIKMFNENIQDKLNHQFNLHSNLIRTFENVGIFDNMERLVFILEELTPEKEKEHIDLEEYVYSIKKEVTQDLVLIVLNKLIKMSKNNNSLFQEDAHLLLRTFLESIGNKAFFFNIKLDEEMVKDFVKIYDNKNNHIFKTIQKTYRVFDPLWTELNKLLSVGAGLIGSKNAEERQLDLMYSHKINNRSRKIKRQEEIDVNHLDYINKRIKEVISEIKEKYPDTYSVPLRKALMSHMKHIDQRILASNAMSDRKFEGLIEYIKTINDYGDLKLDTVSIDNIAKVSLSGKTINVNFADKYDELSIYVTDQFVQDLKDSFIIKETQDFNLRKDYGSILEIRFNDDIINKYKELNKIDEKDALEELKQVIGYILVENINSIKEGSFSKNLIKDVGILTMQNQLLIHKQTFEDNLMAKLREFTLGIKMLNANNKNEKEVMVKRKL